MSAPTRIQLQRVKGWSLAAEAGPDACSVARPHLFGNPYRLGTRTALARVPAADLVTPWEYEGRLSAAAGMHDCHWPNGDVSRHTVRYMTVHEVVATHRRALLAPVKNGPRLVTRYRGSVYQIGVQLVRSELAGRDLACFCRLGQPCHADTLLWVANAPLEQVEAAVAAEYEIVEAMRARVAALHPEVPHARIQD